MTNRKSLAVAALLALAPICSQAKELPKAGAGPPALIDLTDLKLDIANMRGQTIRVAGTLQAIGDTIFLKTELLDMSPIWVNGSHLSRVDRKALLTGCASFCTATLIARVGSNAIGGPGLDAISLEGFTAE